MVAFSSIMLFSPIKIGPASAKIEALSRTNVLFPMVIVPLSWLSKHTIAPASIFTLKKKRQILNTILLPLKNVVSLLSLYFARLHRLRACTKQSKGASRHVRYLMKILKTGQRSQPLDTAT